MTTEAPSPIILDAHHLLAHSSHPFLLILAVVVVGAFVLSKIPGLEHLVKPLFGALFKLGEALVTMLWSWVVYALKALLEAHLTFLKHLMLPAGAIDPTSDMRREAERQ